MCPVQNNKSIDAMSIFTIGSALSSGITIYSRANQIKDVVNDIGGWLRSKSPEEEKRVRSNLEKLGRRLDALSQPLQFCMSWCQDKGSCISDSVYQAKRIQGEIDDFIQNLKGITKVSDHDKVYEMINEHIRELDFAFNSLNLSLNVIIASRTSIPNGSSVVPQSGSGEFKISPSSLLCASSRIRDMYEIGGDVCIASGLYLTRKTVQNERLTPGPWKKVSSSAFLNVVHNYRECKYYIRISNPPLGLDSPVTGFKTEFVLSQDLNFKLGNPSSFAIDIDDKNVVPFLFKLCFRFP